MQKTHLFFKSFIKKGFILLVLFFSFSSLALNQEEEAFLKAAQEGDLEAVNFYIKKSKTQEIDINVKDQKEGWTALYWATYYDYPKIVKALVEAGADVNATENYDSTALILAAEFNRLEIVEILVDVSEIKMNAQDFYGMTALIRAAYRNHPEIVTVIVNTQGTEVNITDDEGMTALDRAQESFKTGIQASLKQAGGKRSKDLL